MSGPTLESLVSPEYATYLVQLFQRFLSNDKAIREPAEQELDSALQHSPDQFLGAMGDLISTHEREDVRSMSAILLRKLASREPPYPDSTPTIQRDAYWIHLQQQTRTFIQARLITSLEREHVKQVRNKVCTLVGGLLVNNMATRVLQTENPNSLRTAVQGWPELLGTLYHFAQSDSDMHREITYKVIAQVPAIVEEQDVDHVKSVLGAGLRDRSIQVRAQGLKAMVNYVLLHDAKEAVKQFPGIVPPMVDILVALAEGQSANDEELLSDCLGTLADLAEWIPKLFKTSVDRLVDFVAAMLNAGDRFMSSTKWAALEVLLAISDRSKVMIRKSRFCATIVPLLLQMMVNITDEEEWYTNLNDEKTEDEEYEVAPQILDRLSLNLGGADVIPIAYPHIQRMFSSAQWQERHAALVVISNLAEGCHDIMLPELSSILSMVLEFANDVHPRVRYAACTAIGQMAIDFAPDLQMRHSRNIYPVLLALMQDSAVPKVQLHAAGASVNLTESIELTALEPFMDDIMNACSQLFNGHHVLQEEAVSLITTVANVAEGQFVKYYGAVMPILLSILQQATQKEHATLRSRALECAMLSALAVGKEALGNDAQVLLTVLSQAQREIEADPSSALSSFLPLAWGRMCKILGTEFAPYLQYVMPSLIVTSKQLPKYKVLNDDEEPEEDDDWDYTEHQGQRIGIMSSLLEDKCLAVEMFLVYAKELGADFAPYAPEVLAICIGLLGFDFHPGVKVAAAGCIPHLFKALILSPAERNSILVAWQGTSDSMMNQVLKGRTNVRMREDGEGLAALFKAYGDTMEEMGPGFGQMTLHGDNMVKFVGVVKNEIKHWLDTLSERLGSFLIFGRLLVATLNFVVSFVAMVNAPDQDEEAEQLDEIMEIDEDILSEASKCTHKVFKVQGTTLFGAFANLLEPLEAMMQSGDFKMTVPWALGIFCDLVQSTGPDAFQYQEHFLQRFIGGIVGDSPDLRQCAAYGIGVCAQYGGPNFYPAMAGAISNLVTAIAGSFINDPQHENREVTENAISALGKIYRFVLATSQGAQALVGQVDPDQLLKQWVEAFLKLPVLSDTIEAPFNVELLLDLVSSQNAVVLGSNNSNLAHIARALGEVLITEALVEDQAELQKRVATMFTSLLNSLDAAARKAVEDSFSVESLVVLRKYLR
ncbi:armadillo-type protein [Cladochytrium replicatum]|nr:armadillo-type protein [Cladochytrium replicatum]